LIIQLVFTVIILFPSFFSYLSLFQNSTRSDFLNFNQGSLETNYLISFIYPFPFGAASYQGTNISSFYYKNESHLYLGICMITTLILFFQNLTKKYFKFGLLLIIFFIFANFLNLLPFNLFRYWIRAEYIFSLYLTLCLPQFFNIQKKFSSFNLISIGLFICLIIISFSEKNLVYVFKNSLIADFYTVTLPFFIFLIFYLFFLIRKKYDFLLILISLDIVYFSLLPLDSMFISKDRVYYQPISNIINTSSFSSDYSLAYNNSNPSGYTQLIPKNGTLRDSYLSEEIVLKLYLICLVLFVALFYWLRRLKL